MRKGEGARGPRTRLAPSHLDHEGPPRYPRRPRNPPSPLLLPQSARRLTVHGRQLPSPVASPPCPRRFSPLPPSHPTLPVVYAKTPRPRLGKAAEIDPFHPFLIARPRPSLVAPPPLHCRTPPSKSPPPKKSRTQAKRHRVIAERPPLQYSLPLASTGREAGGQRKGVGRGCEMRGAVRARYRLRRRQEHYG